MLDAANSIDYIDITSTSSFSDLANEFINTEPVDTIDPVITLEQEALSAFKQAVYDIKEIRARRVCQNAVSMGKDSTLLLLASLEAHKQLINEGKIAQDAVFIVSTINTGVENHLMQMLVHEEVARLRAYCEVQKINLDVRFATPPLSRQWASLFLSGHKMLSTARLNSDCSVILKINSSERIERDIKATYGDVCILIGSRLDESTARAQSLKSKNQASRDVMDFLDNVEAKREENVFAPISHITTEQVWLLLRRAGTNPIIKPTSEDFSLSSYADNHLLLSVVYGDSTDGTCPTTSKNVPGQGIGGCGKSSRTGCSVCLRVGRDSSGEAQNRLPRHSVISDNMLKVRNYMAFVAEDMSKRTWHTRAIDQTTGAIAAYPNVLNAQTIDELIKLLIQCTIDDYFRAKQFKQRVRVGDEMLDKGYADIINDTTLTARERELFADVYKRHAQNQLHTPMSKEISMYLSFVHARDGMKLPPYRAIALWKELYEDFIDAVNECIYTEHSKNNFINIEEAHAMTVKEYEQKGIRMPYPEVDASKAPKEDVPDAVMIMPEISLDEYDYVPHTGMFSAEDVAGCMVDVEHDKIKLPLTQASKILPSDHTITSSSVSLRGFVMDDSFSVFRQKRKSVAAKKELSKRANTKVSRKNGQFKVVTKGRTSVGSHSFSQRTNDTVLTQRLASQVSTPKLSLKPHFIPMNEANDETVGTYALSVEGFYNWIDYDGYERAMEKHDAFIEHKRANGQSIYYWSGIHVVEEMQRYGLFDLSVNAIRSSMNSLKRTAYFGDMGLFRLSDEDFTELATLSSKDEGYQEALVKFNHLHVKSVMSMPDYRNLKAQTLIGIRKARNANRAILKRQREWFLKDALAHDLHQVEGYFTDLLTDLYFQVDYYLNDLSVSNYGRSAIEGYAKFLSSALTDEVYFTRFLSAAARKQIKRDLNAKQKVTQLRKRIHSTLIEMQILSTFDIEWQEFKGQQVSIKKKPVEFESTVIW